MSFEFLFLLAIQYITEYPSPTLFGLLAVGPTLYFCSRKRMSVLVASLAAASVSSLLIIGAEMMMRGLSALFPIGLALTFILLLPFCLVSTATLRFLAKRFVSP